MPRSPRAEQFSPDEVGYVHLIQRCVRRAYLAGVDALSGKNYEFRREWIRARMERLASVFGIDLLSYAILSNHLHLVVRTRPDVVKTWSDNDVAIRWLKIFPGRRLEEHLGEPTSTDVKALAADPDRIAVIRKRLSNPSWLMKALCEPIARLANQQDEVTGHFWEGRFKAVALIDEAALLACSMYVDLNPIRAAMTESPEQARHTSAYDRMKASKGETIPSAAAELIPIETEEAGKILRNSTPDELRKRKAEAKKRRGPSIARDAWLSPLTLSPKVNQGPQPSQSGVRASDRGFLSLDWKAYWKLLVWTAEQKGKIFSMTSVPKEMESIFQRVGIDGRMFCDLVWNFKKYFGRSSAAGSPKNLKETAERRHSTFTRGQRSAANCFTS
jgi:hypothetical protein